MEVVEHAGLAERLGRERMVFNAHLAIERYLAQRFDWIVTGKAGAASGAGSGVGTTRTGSGLLTSRRTSRCGKGIAIWPPPGVFPS